MKKYMLLLAVFFLTISCFNDPLAGIKRLARSSDIEKKKQAGREYEEAINTLVQAYSSYAGVNKDVGRRLMLENHHKPALEHLKKAVEIRNNDAELYYWIGVCYANLSRIENDAGYRLDAKYYYEIALNLTPTNKAFLYSYAHLLVFGLEDYVKAEEILYKYVYELHTQDIEGYMLLGRTYYMLGFNSQSRNLEREYFNKAYNVYQKIHEKKKNLTDDQLKQLEKNIRITREALEG